MTLKELGSLIQKRAYRRHLDAVQMGHTLGISTSSVHRMYQGDFSCIPCEYELYWSTLRNLIGIDVRDLYENAE